jgi:hypothetical protein
MPHRHYSYFIVGFTNQLDFPKAGVLRAPSLVLQDPQPCPNTHVSGTGDLLRHSRECGVERRRPFAGGVIELA